MQTTLLIFINRLSTYNLISFLLDIIKHRFSVYVDRVLQRIGEDHCLGHCDKKLYMNISFFEYLL